MIVSPLTSFESSLENRRHDEELPEFEMRRGNGNEHENPRNAPIGMAVALSNLSDAYQIVYAGGQIDLPAESRAMKDSYESVAEPPKHHKRAWQDQIAATWVPYRTWDAMTDQQKVDHAAQSNGAIKWADILRGNSDSKVMPPFSVAIK